MVQFAFLFSVAVITSGLQGFRRLNLTNNNFSGEHIKDMNNFINTKHTSFISYITN